MGMNDLPEETKIDYNCEDCLCRTCNESVINTSGGNCFNCSDCEEWNLHVEQCSAYCKE